MSRQPLNIGLFGFGCVGYGLYEVLQKTPGLRATIQRICVRNPDKTRPIDASQFTYDRTEILNDPTINTVVELIDDADAAFEIVSEALSKGKAVVSANKKMIATHFEELLALQNKYQTPLLYEAACCASIPIIRNLEEYYDNDLLESIEGIVNGSTNYILTQTATMGVSYADALLDAQQRGYAESNPILDTGGYDAKYKLLILLAHAFGIVALPDELLNIGIDRLGELELRYAREKGYKIKLVAQAFKKADGTVSGFVLPKFVTPQDKLHSVDDVFNGLITQTAFADTQFFVGRGAGAYPTASAVISDISALSYGYRYEYKKLLQGQRPILNEAVSVNILLRHSVQEQAQFIPLFQQVHESYLNHQSGYIIGDIDLAQLRCLSTDPSLSVILNAINTE